MGCFLKEHDPGFSRQLSFKTNNNQIPLSNCHIYHTSPGPEQVVTFDYIDKITDHGEKSLPKEEEVGIVRNFTETKSRKE